MSARGFTLVELLLAIGVIGILAAVVIAAVNPARQFAKARNAERRSDVKAVLDAVQQYSVDNRGNPPSGADGTWRMIGTGTDGCSVACGVANTAQLSIPAVADAWVFQWSVNANDNYGGNAQIHVYPWSGPSVTKRGLLRFSLDPLPADATVTGAHVSLLEAATRGYNRVLALHRATKNWTENGVTWNRYDGTNPWETAGGDYDATPSATANVLWNGGPLDRDTWDVTEDVVDFRSGAKTNNGWILRDTVEDSSQDYWFFHSREAAGPADRPFLLVDYLGASDAGGTTPSSCLDLSLVLEPAYLSAIPSDPQTGDSARTRYAIRAAAGRVSVRACGAELGENIAVVR